MLPVTLGSLRAGSCRYRVHLPPSAFRLGWDHRRRSGEGLDGLYDSRPIAPNPNLRPEVPAAHLTPAKP